MFSYTYPHHHEQFNDLVCEVTSACLEVISEDTLDKNVDNKMIETMSTVCVNLLCIYKILNHVYLLMLGREPEAMYRK